MITPIDGSVKWYGCVTRELALRNWRECKVLGRARWSMSETVWSLRSDRFVTDRSLRSDRQRGLVGRYVATDSSWIGRYVVTDSCAGWLFADRSLRGDLVCILFWCFMNVFFRSDEWTKINAMFYVKTFRKSNLLQRILFVKNVHVNFYRYLDVNFVVFLIPTKISKRHW